MKAAHFIRYRAEGLNRNNLINTLKKNGVALYKITENGAKITEFSIESREKRKFFAITENLCYNITRIREHGVVFPIVALLRRVGAVVGIAIFIAALVVSDRAVFAVDYYGSGAVYKEEAAAALSKLGIKEFSAVTSGDLRAAETEIMKSPSFSFASVKKQGARLKVNLVLSPQAAGVVDYSKTILTAPVKGVVESLKVYRGTAAVAVGDEVEAGAALVEGYNIIKETRVETYVLATVTLLAEHRAIYKANPDVALSLAREAVGGCEIADEAVTETPDGCEVVLKYRIKVK